MKIDPLRENIMTAEFYLAYDYQIMPDMAYQNVDLSDRILKSYNTYMTNGELYTYILDNLSYELELRYLKEILSLSVDYGNNMIYVSLRHKDAASCQETMKNILRGKKNPNRSWRPPNAGQLRTQSRFILLQALLLPFFAW